MDVVLYSTHCPRCNVLEKKLNMKNIPYQINIDEEEMYRKGYFDLPVLEVKGEPLPFNAANMWINNWGED